MFFGVGYFRGDIPDQARAGSPVARPGDPLSPRCPGGFGLREAGPRARREAGAARWPDQSRSAWRQGVSLLICVGMRIKVGRPSLARSSLISGKHMPLTAK